MSNSLLELIEISLDVKNHLNLSSFAMYVYEDGSYCEFLVSKIKDPKVLLDITQGLEIFLCADKDNIIVRLFERV